MRNYEAAARILAEKAGAMYSFEQVPNRRRKFPVIHYRVEFDGATILDNDPQRIIREVKALAA